MALTIAEIPVAGGVLGICPLPGREGDYAGDLAAMIGWRPALVLSLTGAEEAVLRGAGALGADLAAAGIAHGGYAIPDFGTPDRAARSLWPGLSAALRARLGAGERVLLHCLGGCGRSGMVVLRLMVETGEEGEAALARLRAARPCAVETKAQMRWALLQAEG